MNVTFTRCQSCHFYRHAYRSVTATRSRQYSAGRPFFKVSEEVQEALHSGKPVVALETTIYTHGTSYRREDCMIF